MGYLNRRIFLLQIALTGPALAAATDATPKVDPKDAQAAALGYVADTNRADAKKYPQHAATQKCGVCQLYQGKAGDAYGPCPIFAGHLVSSGGWCSSFVKKPA